MTLESLMEAILKANGLTGFVREYRFLPGRKFRLDFAWPERKVGVEVQGGQYIRGAHQRPKRYQSDCEKLDLGQISGWIILWFTSGDIYERPKHVAELVRAALRGRV